MFYTHPPIEDNGELLKSKIKNTRKGENYVKRNRSEKESVSDRRRKEPKCEQRRSAQEGDKRSEVLQAERNLPEMNMDAAYESPDIIQNMGVLQKRDRAGW